MYKEFNLFDVVSKIPASTTGCLSGGTSSSETTGEQAINLKYSFLDCDLGGGSHFDERAFKVQLLEEVREKIREFGASVGASGMSGHVLSHDYQYGRTYGWIEIMVVRGEGNHYKVASSVREVTPGR